MQIKINLHDYCQLIVLMQEAGIKMNRWGCHFIYEAGDVLTVPPSAVDKVKEIMNSDAWRKRDK
jgi:hypothetical protein